MRAFRNVRLYYCHRCGDRYGGDKYCPICGEPGVLA